MEAYYFKNRNNELYVEPSKEVIDNNSLEEITEREFNGLLAVKNIPTEEQELQTKLQEAHQYLKDTDWVKMYLLEHYLGLNLLPEDSYKFEIERIRNEKIEFIRSNS